jgi:TolB-like protein/Tfp pilus assembly protein PilF
MASLFGELKRRNVFKVGAAYLVLGWVVVQVTDTVAPAMGLPDFTLKLVIWLGAIGFPFALLFAWAFELTPEGVKRTKDVQAEESITRHTGHKLNYVIIGLMAAAIGALLLDRIVQSNRSEIQATAEPAPAAAAPAAQTPTAEAQSPLDSIAVLPFVNMSEDKENEHFGDGLSEELLNLLAKVDGLRVAARTSTFYFKDKDATIADVATALDVDTVLEGSVRRSGDTIRVVAQLIDASDSTHLWSEKYDRPLTDIFKVQDDIANQIVAALMPHLDADATPVVASGAADISPEQFERFMLARHEYWESTEDSVTRARDEFLALTKSAPGYAPAWAWLARSWLTLETLTEGRVAASIAEPAADRAIRTALELDPDEPMAHVARGWLAIYREHDAMALESFDRAVQIDPMQVDALMGRQRALVGLGRPEEAIATLERARSIDPLHPMVLWNLAHLRNLQGERVEAFEALDRLYAVSPNIASYMESHLYWDSQEEGRGIYVSEIKHAEGVYSDDDLAWLYQMINLHDEALILRTDRAHLSLAVMGKREAALEAMNGLLEETDDLQRRAAIQWETYLALGEFERARDILWERWLNKDKAEAGSDLGYRERFAVAAVLLKTGETDKAAEVAAFVAETLGDTSPLHNGIYLRTRGYIALLNGDPDAAAGFFDEFAERGDTGDWSYGKPVRLYWLMESDPRFAPILERIEANRDRQIAELERLRASGMSAAQVRDEYLASVTTELR